MTAARYEILTERMSGQQIIVHQVNMIAPDPLDPTKEIRETVICQMLNVGEAQVKRKLMELGWTPPDAGLKGLVAAVIAARIDAGGITPALHNAIAALTVFK